MFARLPLNVMVALKLALPMTNDSPVIWLNFNVPFVAVTVTCSGAVPASTSPMLGALAPLSVSSAPSSTACAAGSVSVGGLLTF